jgi:hypothetical protein
MTVAGLSSGHCCETQYVFAKRFGIQARRERFAAWLAYPSFFAAFFFLFFFFIFAMAAILRLRVDPRSGC